MSSEQSITFDTGIRLDSGRILAPITLVYETYGTLNDSRIQRHPGGACLDRQCPPGRQARVPKIPKPGWWDAIVGPGRLLDTDRYFVICSNVIGSCYGSTGPASINPKTGKRYNLTFPVVTVRDMVRAQKLLIDALGIERLLCVMGGSMGGMQALEWATQYPDRIASAIVLAATPRPSPRPSP